MTDPQADKDSISGISQEDTILKLEEIDTNLYRGHNLWTPRGAHGVFGGQMVGQALVAAGHTKPDNFEVHSIHSYFLRVGKADRPILYHVDRLKDGRSFATRFVKAVQNGEAVFTLLVSYHRHEGSTLEHQYLMPTVPPPDTLQNVVELHREQLKTPGLSEKKRVLLQDYSKVELQIEIKPTDPMVYFRKVNTSKQFCWVRAIGNIGSDQNMHRCFAAYMSDFILLTTVTRPDKHFVVGMMMSLDHSMWFHTSVRVDEWLLFECESPRAVDNRGLTLGRLWKEDGTLAISVAQEGLIRPRIPTKNSKL